MTPIVAAAFLVAYYVLSIEIYLATYCVGRFQMSFWGWGPTELRILLAIGALMLLVKPVVTIAGVPMRLFDVGGIVGAIGWCSPPSSRPSGTRAALRSRTAAAEFVVSTQRHGGTEQQTRHAEQRSALRTCVSRLSGRRVDSAPIGAPRTTKRHKHKTLKSRGLDVCAFCLRGAGRCAASGIDAKSLCLCASVSNQQP